MYISLWAYIVIVVDNEYVYSMCMSICTDAQSVFINAYLYPIYHHLLCIYALYHHHYHHHHHHLSFTTSQQEESIEE